MITWRDSDVRTGPLPVNARGQLHTISAVVSGIDRILQGRGCIWWGKAPGVMVTGQGSCLVMILS